jgi:cholest-4-en-3-one 26-monooxygenase
MDLDLLDLDMFQRGEQDELFSRLRREAPVSWQDHPHGRGFWSVVRHADVVTVNRDATLFSSEVGSISLLDPDERANGVGADTRGTMMIASDPPRHTRYRRLVNSGFTPRTMKAIEQSLAGRATGIIDQVIEKGSCDFVTEVAAELPLQAIADIMGVPQEDRGRLRRRHGGLGRDVRLRERSGPPAAGRSTR